MPTGIKPIFINNMMSIYGLSHPHDSKVFPDLPEHQDNPSQLRLQHDGLATDDKARLEPMCLAEANLRLSNKGKVALTWKSKQRKVTVSKIIHLSATYDTEIALKDTRRQD